MEEKTKTTTAEKPHSDKSQQGLSKVLGTMHIWALGVGIVLVGEFMGWNFAVQQGGTIGAIIACWVIALMFVTILMMNTEMGSIMPEAGGQYTMAKYILGPLAAFNVGLMLVIEYAALEAADTIVVGQILQEINPNIDATAFIILSYLVLTYMNYKGAAATLTVNFIITAFAFATIIILVLSTNAFDPESSKIQLQQLSNGLPYGQLGILAAMQFGVWYFLGIEGTALAAEECRSTHRSLPIGAMIGLGTLLVGATLTWFVCSSLVEAGVLGESAYPLYDAAKEVGIPAVKILLFLGTVMACLASANGCINDASRAWFAMSRDKLIPDFFGKTHPKYKSPYRAIIFLLPISMAFAFTGLLDSVVTFSIFSALLVYVITSIMMVRFRKMYPLGSIKRGYTCPIHPIPAIVCAIIALATLFGLYLGYWVNMIAGLVFYFLCSVWFIGRRAKFIDKANFLNVEEHNWPEPKI